ncbi:hypothetical protein CAEBREN_13585 [Caenorhabditis brenneri]|uniref:Uncharacterized protein n=1 Tax=Caenorhabditis brenneri TaxID=135651 RepID=G0ND60_CAEBE|nr:hypothetical protein CAEBREN_13585 [Caenorhabditis brenneri]
MLAAQCVRDDIVKYVTPFFTNFINPDWKYKEAAIMAFGSIPDGPDQKKLLPMAQEALSAIVTAMSYKNVNVRDTAAWALGRVINTCSELANNAELLQSVLPALSNGLHQEPRVSVNVCWVSFSPKSFKFHQFIHFLGTDLPGQSLLRVSSHKLNRRLRTARHLRPLFGLRSDGQRAHQDHRQSRHKSIESSNHRLRSTHGVDQALAKGLQLGRSKHHCYHIEKAASKADKAQVRDLQAMLCATLQSVTRKMQPADIPAVGEFIINGLLQIMNRAAATESNAVIEEALLAVACLAEPRGLVNLNARNRAKQAPQGSECGWPAEDRKFVVFELECSYHPLHHQPNPSVTN